MKRITYNGEPLVTGTAVAEALVHYVTHVAAMAAAVAVDIPALEQNGAVQAHTLVLSAATQLAVIDVDGLSVEEEDSRFPVPEFPPVGGQAFAMPPEDIENDAPFLDDDPYATPHH
jgi:hypothetical protein